MKKDTGLKKLLNQENLLILNHHSQETFDNIEQKPLSLYAGLRGFCLSWVTPCRSPPSDS